AAVRHRGDRPPGLTGRGPHGVARGDDLPAVRRALRPRPGAERPRHREGAGPRRQRVHAVRHRRRLTARYGRGNPPSSVGSPVGLGAVGVVGAGGFDTVMVIVVPGETMLPASRLWAVTVPSGAVPAASFWTVTLRPASSS